MIFCTDLIPCIRKACESLEYARLCQAASALREAKRNRDCDATRLHQPSERRKRAADNFAEASTALFNAAENLAHQEMKKQRLDEEGMLV